MPANESRIFGPPGTGKTSYVTDQINKAVDKRGTTGIVVASFTRAAAYELVSRELPLPRSHVGTLHALAYRQLGSPDIAEPRIPEFNEAGLGFDLGSASADTDDGEYRAGNNPDDLVMNEYQTLRARMIPRELWSPNVLRFANAWEGWKRDNNYADFTDMIEVALDAHLAPPDGATIGFFDEVQDFTPLELALIRMWGEEHLDEVVLAGDDDQAIYGFKGASPDAFLKPELPADRLRFLRQSYRMPHAVHRVTQEWISQITERQDKQFEPRAFEGSVEYRPELAYRDAVSTADAAEAAAAEGRSVMVLTACSYQLAPIVRELKERGSLIHNPYRTKRGDWNPLRTSVRGRTSLDRLTSYLSWHPEIGGAEAHDWTVGEVLDWMPLVKKTGIFRRGSWAKVLGELADETPISQMLAMQLFEEGAIDAIKGDPLGYLIEHRSAAKAAGLAYPLLIAEKRGLGALVNAKPNIIVGTIHSVKGGQADDVFLMPDVSQMGWAQWMDSQQRAHGIRQFYVGMSRAMSRLVLCGPSSGMAVSWPKF